MSNSDESKYLQYLPGIYQPGKGDKRPIFLGKFLKAFEKVLSGIQVYLFSWDEIPGNDNVLIEFFGERFEIEWIKTAKFEKIDNDNTIRVYTEENSLLLRLNDEKTKVILEIDDGRKNEFTVKTVNDRLNIYVDDIYIEDDSVKGIEEILDNIQIYFDPYETPLDFLPWLAERWMALTLKEEEEWDANNSKKKRDLIARIIPLYQKRGTLAGLEEYIRIYVGEDVNISINEFLDPFRVDITSTVGMNTVVGEGRPYFFQVYMELQALDREQLEERKISIIDIIEQKKNSIIDIIELEKPAHTDYLLLIQVPTMQINEHSTIGVDTILGSLIIGKK